MGAFEYNLPHLFLHGRAHPEPYTTRKRGTTEPNPDRDRAAHAAALLDSLNHVLASAHRQFEAQRNVAEAERAFYLEFRLPPGSEDFADKLEDKRRHIELAAVKATSTGVVATVRVPESAKSHFTKKIERYRDELTKTGKPKNQPLISRIDSIALAALKSIFTDRDELFPNQNVPIWWEVWVGNGASQTFKRSALQLNMRVSDQTIHFPEREVLLVFASATDLGLLMVNSSMVFEVRRAMDSPATFVSLPNVEQREWAEELVARVQPPPLNAPSICILDSGITREHPLISVATAAEDVHRYDINWPAGDSNFWHGHGTKMAGVALYGDLQPALLSTERIPLAHRIESVTILDPAGNQHDPKLYGAVTQEAIARAEIQAAQRTRIICMAVTSTVNTAQGVPSSWSAALDAAAYGEGEAQRLILVSAGNIRDNITRDEYPARNDTEPIENPAQAWNALTIGGYTERIDILDPTLRDWRAIAGTGDLSPTSRTSVSWQRQWPVKPDVVFEAGNLASDGQMTSAVDDLSLISTYHRPAEKHFEVFSETSAATALAANFAARLTVFRPESWPETTRALVVHSAEWTPAMRAQFEERRRRIEKLPLFRRYGYGVPNLKTAQFSALNDMTLIMEDEIQPFWKDPNDGRVKTRHMNLYRLPWPRQELQQIGDMAIQLRVTLSYFIEPNPGERGWTRRHRYASHGLRFSFKRSTETVNEFRARINQAVEAEESGTVAEEEPDNWYLGMLRDAGSIHSDYWSGTGAELATRDAIAIFPVTGWWKEKPNLERYERTVRYSLLLSIRAINTDVDIYTPVQVAIRTPVAVPVRT
jgi:Subtilase family